MIKNPNVIRQWNLAQNLALVSSAHCQHIVRMRFQPQKYFQLNSRATALLTRMLSSRMRTGHSLTVCGGGLPAGGVSLLGGLLARGEGVFLLGGLLAWGSPCWGTSLPGGSPCRGGSPCWGVSLLGGLLAGVSLPGGSPCQRPPLCTESQTRVKT